MASVLDKLTFPGAADEPVEEVSSEETENRKRIAEQQAQYGIADQPDEAGLIESDVIPNADYELAQKGYRMGAAPTPPKGGSPSTLGRLQKPDLHVDRRWNQLWEAASPARRQELMQLGKERAVADAIAAERRAAGRAASEAKSRVPRSNKQTAEEIRYSRTNDAFGDRQDVMADPRVTPRK